VIARRMRGATRGRSLARKADVLRPPRGLEAYTFAVADDDYAIFTFPTSDAEPPPGMSAAEREIVRAVVEGRSNKEIAAERGTSPYTVANQLRSIYAKLGVSSRFELIARCNSK
jgi:DNA-binding CsgD family transcriptional regulator